MRKATGVFLDFFVLDFFVVAIGFFTTGKSDRPVRSDRNKGPFEAIKWVLLEWQKALEIWQQKAQPNLVGTIDVIVSYDVMHMLSI